jgi:hypothetical protein
VTDKVQIVAVAASIGLLLVVLELVRRRRLVEEYSLLWVVAAVALIGVSLRRGVLDTVARWLDVHYPPAVLVLLLILIVFIASLCFSVILSGQQRQIERLIDETSVLAAELRDLRDARRARDNGSDERVTENGASDLKEHPRSTDSPAPDETRQPRFPAA